MPRTNRIETSDGLYHVINRGNYRQFVFKTEGARNAFEVALFEACGRFSWQLHAYCILSNHFHLCIGTPQGNLSSGMQWLQGTFARRFNQFRKERGHLFQGRFKSLVVERGKHFADLVNYIHLNPLRAGLADIETLSKYRWSSLYHFPKRKMRQAFFEAGWMSCANGEGLTDTRGGWNRYSRLLQLGAADEPKQIKSLERRMCRGWCIGEKEFKEALVKELLEAEGQLRLEKDELEDFNRTQWEMALKTCLKALGKRRSEAKKSKYSEAWKLAIASKLKRETSVTNAWLSEALYMGEPKSVSNLCGKYTKNREKKCPHAQILKSHKI